MRCTGLLCMLGDGCEAAAAADCAQRIALLRTAFLADPGAAVREAAAKALCDLAVLRWVALKFTHFVSIESRTLHRPYTLNPPLHPP